MFLIFALNQTLIAMGLSPLPFDDSQIESGISSIFLVASGIWVWWKNNAVTIKAQRAQKNLDESKESKL